MTEKRYAIVGKVLLNFMTHQDQGSVIFYPEDNAELIVDGHDIYLLYEGEKRETIDGLNLIVHSVETGALREITEESDRTKKSSI